MGQYSSIKERAVEIYTALPSNLSHTERSKQTASQLNIPYHDSFRKRLGEWTADKNFDNITDTETNQYFVTKQLSAVKADGKIMNIDEYCLTYGIPREHVRTYKLINHTGESYYNIASTNLEELPDGFDIYSKIEELIEGYKPNSYFYGVSPIDGLKTIVQLVITDCHVAMSTNHDGFSLYGGNWSKEDLKERQFVILRELQRIVDQIGEVDCIQVINLGDLADGLDAQTVRKGHQLNQNMSNEECFDTAVDFLVGIMDYIVRNLGAQKIIWYNVCNSNHSSSFDYFICQTLKGIARVSHSEVEVINERKFIGHFTYGNHTEIITHGKDDVNLKFGFKAQLDQKGKERIAEYIRFHQLQKPNHHITFHKGDSHVYVQDKSEDYDYNSYLALSPSSSWVQANFKSGRSGFAINVKHKDNYTRTRHDFEFEWNSNKLK